MEGNALKTMMVGWALSPVSSNSAAPSHFGTPKRGTGALRGQDSLSSLKTGVVTQPQETAEDEFNGTRSQHSKLELLF